MSRMQPLRHWTDSKIRCHLFSCVVALTYLRRLERKLNARGIARTATSVMDEMRHRAIVEAAILLNAQEELVP